MLDTQRFCRIFFGRVEFASVLMQCSREPPRFVDVARPSFPKSSGFVPADRPLSYKRGDKKSNMTQRDPPGTHGNSGLPKDRLAKTKLEVVLQSWRSGFNQRDEHLSEFAILAA